MEILVRIILFFYAGAITSWVLVQANCDDSSCPIVCTAYPCPAFGDGYRLPIDPVTSSPSCQEVIVQSPGYPNGYAGDRCRWVFINTAVAFSYVVTVLDFEGDPGDIIRIRRSLPGRNDVFIVGDSDAITTSKGYPFFSSDRAVRLQVNFLPTGGVAFTRGVKLRINFAQYVPDACTTTDAISLTDAKPIGVFQSPRYGFRYPNNAACYYSITSPTDRATQIVIEFLHRFSIRILVSFLYIYDNSGDDPQLLRLFSNRPMDDRFNLKIRTGTNSLLIAFTGGNPGRRSGFFGRVSFEDIPSTCSGHGTLVDQCDCSATTSGGPKCEDSNDDKFKQFETPTMLSDLTNPSCDDVTFRFTHDGNNANALLASPHYFGAVGGAGPVECLWSFIGEPSYKYALIIRDLDSDVGNRDVLSITTDTSPEDENPTIMRYSNAVVGGVIDLPVTRGGAETFPLIDTPIFIDKPSFQISYQDNTADGTAFRGILFEVHLLDEGICSEACVNGGQCTGYCDCEEGYQGFHCEQTKPPDYTCLVKNHYIPHNFAYSVQIHAIAGTNVFDPEAFEFDAYGFSKTVWISPSLPSDAEIREEIYGKKLSLPGMCDVKKSSDETRFGVIKCVFKGNDAVERCDIPAIVNYKSEVIFPVGRFTKTVSVDDGMAALSVGIWGVEESSIRWRFNGQLMRQWNGRSTVEIHNIRVDDGGIYEAFVKGRSEHDRVVFRLIVRGCPDGSYGLPDCDVKCPQCLNGGTCSDVHGTCVCPPGYAGETCAELLTGSTISRNPEYTCHGLGIAYPGCKKPLFCLPDPGGCMCMSGWTGPSCDQACPPLKFGLECRFDCHCSGEAQCNPATGACSGTCATTFTGPNCQMTI